MRGFGPCPAGLQDQGKSVSEFDGGRLRIGLRGFSDRNQTMSATGDERSHHKGGSLFLTRNKRSHMHGRQTLNWVS